jgi:hypothetical protein
VAEGPTAGDQRAAADEIVERLVEKIGQQAPEEQWKEGQVPPQRPQQTGSDADMAKDEQGGWTSRSRGSR